MGLGWGKPQSPIAAVGGRSQGRRDDADSGARRQAVTTSSRAVFGLGLLLRSPYRAVRYPTDLKPTAEIITSRRPRHPDVGYISRSHFRGRYGARDNNVQYVLLEEARLLLFDYDE